MPPDPSTAFVSYSRVDSEFALRLTEDLKAAGAKVWLDQLDIIPGQRWDRAVREALNNCPRVLVILSPASVDSENVLDEVDLALEQHKAVVPLFHRDCEIPLRLRRVHRVDFRTDYIRALQSLLKVLSVQQQIDSAAVDSIPTPAHSLDIPDDTGQSIAELLQSKGERKQHNEDELMRPGVPEKAEREQRRLADADQPEVPPEAQLNQEAEPPQLKSESQHGAVEARLEEVRDNVHLPPNPAYAARAEQVRQKAEAERAHEEAQRTAEGGRERTEPGMQGQTEADGAQQEAHRRVEEEPEPQQTDEHETSQHEKARWNRSLVAAVVGFLVILSFFLLRRTGTNSPAKQKPTLQSSSAATSGSPTTPRIGPTTPLERPTTQVPSDTTPGIESKQESNLHRNANDPSESNRTIRSSLGATVPTTQTLGTGNLLLTLNGQKGAVSVAWSPVGDLLATGNHDSTVKVWDGMTGKTLMILTGHRSPVRFVAWSPDGKRLATGSEDETVRVWDATSGKNLLTLPVGTRYQASSVAWSPDGTRLATDDTVWDVMTGHKMLILKGDRNGVRGVAWSPEGNRLATGSYGNTAKVWDAVTGKNLLTLQADRDVVYSVAWSPDGKRLATGGGHATEARVWDVATGKRLLTLPGYFRGVGKVAWSPDGKRLAAVGGMTTRQSCGTQRQARNC